MPSPRQRLKARQASEGQKVKVADSATTPLIDYPIFCFKHLSNGHGIDNCSGEEKVAFLARIVKLSSMTWDQIKLANRHGLGSEKIAIGSIRPQLPAFISSDVSFLLALRFDGMKPFLAHQSGAIMHVLFIDNNFDVYDHGV